MDETTAKPVATVSKPVATVWVQLHLFLRTDSEESFIKIGKLILPLCECLKT